MPEPSLSEITSIAADPERGSGTPAVVIDTSSVVKSVQEAARLKQENDWKKYTTFQSNLKDLYKNAQDIEAMDMAPQDREALQKQIGGIFQQIGEDPQGFFGGGPKMTKIQQQLGGLLSQATQSKQDQMYDTAHREFLTRNPGWATPDNMKKVDSYLNQPLGKRKPFLLQPTPVLDFDAMSSSINGVIGKNVSGTGFTGVDKGGNQVPGDQYIVKTKGKQYPTDRYMALAEASWDTAGQYGIKNRDAAEGLFKELPAETQKAYGSAKQWYMTQMVARHKENETESSELTPNRFAEMSERNKFLLGMEAYKQGYRKDLAEYKHSLSTSGAPGNINFLVRQYASIAGNKTGDKKQVQVDGKWQDEDVLNVPPDVLKKFAGAGRTTIKSGKGGETETTTVSNTPDLITRTKDGDLRAHYYQRYTEADKKAHRIPKGKDVGDVVHSTTGMTLGSNNVIPKRQVMGLLGKDFVEKKMIGGSIDAADRIIGQQGDVTSFLDKVQSGEDEVDEEEEGGGGSASAAPVKTKETTSVKVYSYKGKKFNLDQIKKAADASGLTPEEYIKQMGLK